MEGARFEFSFDELGFERWGETGSEQIELLYQPAPTSKPRPLRRIASGGELSRILLALECMHYASAGHDGGRTTIIFDEVDSGIGGATATRSPGVSPRFPRVPRSSSSRIWPRSRPLPTSITW